MAVVVSYAKQMIEVAQRWLRLNPDAKSPFLRVPGLDKNSRAPNQLTPDQLTRYEVAAGQQPKLAPLVEHFKTLVGEVSQARRDLNQCEAALEDTLNAPKPGQQKYTVDDRLSTAGRWCLSWARSGYNTFDLSPDFVAAMLLTDARALDVDLVRLPFPAILIATPPGFAIGVEGRSYTRIHVTEISASDVRMLHAAEQVSRAIVNLPPEEARKTLDALLLRESPPTSLLDKANGTQSLLSSGALRASATAGSLHIYASDGEHVLDTLIDREGLTWDSFDDLPDNVTDDADKRARQTLRQIVFGMLAYANAIDHALEPRDNTARRRRVPADKPHPEHWTIGRTVRIDPQLVRLAQSGNREALFRLKHRHIVRGHYRNQAHGPQRALRTSRWITPYWKGPQDGAELVHTYKLDESKEKESP